VIVCNLDERPGYSGVENPLYKDEKVIMLLGDAKETMGEIIGLLSAKKELAQGGPRGAITSAYNALMDAKSVVIVPGYGMALAHAQFKVVELMKLFEEAGKTVKFAIHPVAGRMPGHMNVLLAEADVPYDKLHEMDDINPEFPATDVAIIVGACDVVNPAAIRTEGTPISGMPILNVHEAKHVIVCNLDERPGYSGVENPLYKDEKVIMLLGDAKETMKEVINRLNGKRNG
jgi:NAD(P) transhydrogenase subunit beta